MADEEDWEAFEEKLRLEPAEGRPAANPVAAGSPNSKNKVPRSSKNSSLPKQSAAAFHPSYSSGDRHRAKLDSGSSGAPILVKEYDPDEIECEDPEEERSRLRKVQMRSEAQLTSDLFGGCANAQNAQDFGTTKVRELLKIVEKDSFAELKITSVKQAEDLADKSAEKLLKCSSELAPFSFIKRMISACQDKLSRDSLKKLKDLCESLDAEKRKAAAAREANQKKQKADVGNMKKGAKVDIHDEMNTVYGGDYYYANGEDDEDKYYDDDDDDDEGYEAYM